MTASPNPAMTGWRSMIGTIPSPPRWRARPCRLTKTKRPLALPSTPTKAALSLVQAGPCALSTRRAMNSGRRLFPEPSGPSTSRATDAMSSRHMTTAPSAGTGWRMAARCWPSFPSPTVKTSSCGRRTAITIPHPVRTKPWLGHKQRMGPGGRIRARVALPGIFRTCHHPTNPACGRH